MIFKKWLILLATLVKNNVAAPKAIKKLTPPPGNNGVIRPASHALMPVITTAFNVREGKMSLRQILSLGSLLIFLAIVIVFSVAGSHLGALNN